MSGGRSRGVTADRKRVIVVVRSAVAVVATLLASACSLAFPADAPQCVTSTDCTARGGAFSGSVCVNGACVPHDASAAQDAQRDAVTDARHDVRGDVVGDASHVEAGASPGDAAPGDAGPLNDWSCLGHVRLPEASTTRVALTVPYIDLLTSSPIRGMQVQPCQKLDPTCTSPLEEAGVTNDAGLITLSVPSGYDGYLLSVWDAGQPALVYMNPPVTRSTVVAPEYMLSTTTLNAVAGAVRTPDGGAIPIDPDLGILFLGAYDCAGASAAGVSFALAPAAPSAIEAYLINGIPSTTASSTDSFGSGAFVDVPPGTVTITATLAGSHQTIGTATGFSQPGRITFLSLAPSP